jgi:glycosyltransferase involved in cell wall biosynthesis
VVSRHDLSRVGLASPKQVPDGRLGSVVEVPADRAAIERDRDHVGRLHSYEARARRFLEIIPEAPRLADGARTLGFYPNYWNHPYVQNLYRGLRSRGVRAVPVARPDSLLDAAGLRGRSLFHLQWTAPVLAGATSADDAVERADAFLRQLDELRSARTPIIWTVHNVLPHDCAHPAAEIQLCQGLADRSDVVHVLNNATLEATAPLYRLPADRVRVIPYYEDPVTQTVSPSAARARLSLGDDDVVYLAFGRIRPYKQLGRLLDAFAEHRRSHPRSRLLVAGQLERFSGSARLAARCRREPGVVARFGRVADDDIELLFAASDATVVSYPILNSAVAVTSVAHGCPVAAVDSGGLPETVGQDGGLVFGSDENLADVLDRLYALVTETDIRERTTALGRRHSAAVMATAFAEVVATHA